MCVLVAEVWIVGVYWVVRWGGDRSGLGDVGDFT